MSMASRAPWWRGAVIYQIYLRSFQDSDADGIGDLRGIRQNLGYIASLGVDAICISPFFRGLSAEPGCGITDFRGVDPIFGTLADVDALIAVAHAHGLKVLIDQVIGHTSEQHPWFVESRAGRHNPRADWYVWADANADGTPPNNWQSASVPGGSAWQWDAQRCQYYLHRFLASQPDLNFHHAPVQEAALADIRFWLGRGIDGVALNDADFLFHDALLRDNPPREVVEYNPAIDDTTPYAWQAHVYDKNRPESIDFLRRVRALTGAYPGIATIGRIRDDDTLARIAEYTGGGDKLHMACSVDLLGPRCDARFLHQLIARFEETADASAWACWALSSPDAQRVATRWSHPGLLDSPDLHAAWLRLIVALQLALRGSPCLYQGDELGLTDADLPLACRTPMVWDGGSSTGGFTTGTRPWLSPAPEHLALNAQSQSADPASLLNHYRAMLEWRRTRPELRVGAIELLPSDDAVLAFIRRDAYGALLCAFNCTAAQVDYHLPPQARPSLLEASHPLPGATLAGATLKLPPYGVAFGAV
jgi:alpha-glucosidase